MRKYTTAQRLKEVMALKKIRQIDIVRLAEPYCNVFKVKLGRNDISQYCSGIATPGQSKLNVMALALDVNEMWLMGYDVPMDRSDDPTDTEFIASLGKIKDKEELPPEVAAINTILYPNGKQIIKVNGEYYFDEAGHLTKDELNDLINTIAISVNSAAEMLIQKKQNILRQYLASDKT